MAMVFRHITNEMVNHMILLLDTLISSRLKELNNKNYINENLFKKEWRWK